MKTLRLNRRHGKRLSAARAVTLWDQEGNFLSNGRTSNVSVGGAFVLLYRKWVQVARHDRVIVEIAQPSDDSPSDEVVAYAARIARVRSKGPMTAVGLEFIERLDSAPDESPP